MQRGKLSRLKSSTTAEGLLVRCRGHRAQICRGISLLAFDGISDLSGHCRWSEPSLSKLLQSAVIERLTITNLHPNARWLLGERLAGKLSRVRVEKLRAKTTKKKMVPRAGFEPARVCETHWPLKPARLPVPPPRHFHAIYIAPTRRLVNAPFRAV
jgi:hypothetical protein